jgi:Ca2+-transporting ATPase
MAQPPRAADASILTGRRIGRLALYGLTMAAGTLTAYAWGESRDGHTYAVTLAFTTFVLFQFFNIFNARAEHDSAFGRQFFDNRRLWLALFCVVGLQFVVVHWAPAQAVFDTVDLTVTDWTLAALIASSVLLFDEMRKLAGRILRSLFAGGFGSKRTTARTA